MQVESLSDDGDDPVLAVYLARRQDLVAYFRARLRSEEAAQDLVQDMYLKIVRRPPGIVDNPIAFLYRLGANQMLDRLKQQDRARRRVSDWGDLHNISAGGEAVADEPRADDRLAARQRLDQILIAIRELPAPVQKAFRLHKLHGLSHAETADAMGVSRSSVEKYLMTCLRHILARVGR